MPRRLNRLRGNHRFRFVGIVSFLCLFLLITAGCENNRPASTEGTPVESTESNTTTPKDESGSSAEKPADDSEKVTIQGMDGSSSAPSDDNNSGSGTTSEPNRADGSDKGDSDTTGEKNSEKDSKREGGNLPKPNKHLPRVDVTAMAKPIPTGTGEKGKSAETGWIDLRGSTAPFLPTPDGDSEGKKSL